jgi:hypothetical protein
LEAFIGVRCVIGERGDCRVGGDGRGGGGMQGRGESNSASSSPLSLSSSTSHRRFTAFWLCLSGRGDVVDEGSVHGASREGAGCADGAVGFTEGGSCKGDGARFIAGGFSSGLRPSVNSCGGILVAAATSTAMTAPGSRADSNSRRWRERAGDRNLMLSCSVADGDMGLEPVSNALIIQDDEIASSHCSCGCRRRNWWQNRW